MRTANLPRTHQISWRPWGCSYQWHLETSWKQPRSVENRGKSAARFLPRQDADYSSSVSAATRRSRPSSRYTSPTISGYRKGHWRCRFCKHNADPWRLSLDQKELSILFPISDGAMVVSKFEVFPGQIPRTNGCENTQRQHYIEIGIDGQFCQKDILFNCQFDGLSEAKVVDSELLGKAPLFVGYCIPSRKLLQQPGVDWVFSVDLDQQFYPATIMNLFAVIISDSYRQ